MTVCMPEQINIYISGLQFLEGNAFVNSSSSLQCYENRLITKYLYQQKSLIAAQTHGSSVEASEGRVACLK